MDVPALYQHCEGKNVKYGGENMAQTRTLEYWNIQTFLTLWIERWSSFAKTNGKKTLDISQKARQKLYCIFYVEVKCYRLWKKGKCVYPQHMDKKERRMCLHSSLGLFVHYSQAEVQSFRTSLSKCSVLRENEMKNEELMLACHFTLAYSFSSF